MGRGACVQEERSSFFNDDSTEILLATRVRGHNVAAIGARKP